MNELIEIVIVGVIGGIIGLLVHSLINDYLNELKQYNSEIENNYRYIALKAAYSNTVILQEELDEIRNYVEECLTLIQENNSSLKLLSYQYIYVLF